MIKISKPNKKKIKSFDSRLLKHCTNGNNSKNKLTNQDC
jgi:hypothetical protein